MNGIEFVLQWHCIRFKCQMSTYNYEDIHEWRTGGNEMEGINEMFTMSYRGVGQYAL